VSDKGQHVGRLADAIDNSEYEGARGRMKAVMKPQGKAYRGGSDLGDGDLCPVAGHGHMYVSRDRVHQYCPHQSHDKERMRKSDG